VADDAPEFTRIAPDIVSGTCPPLLREFLEVRGLGILNIRAMFGDSSIKRTKYLRLIVHLKRMSADQISGMDRLSGAHSSRDVLNVSVPQVTVPVAPGRNLAVLVESAVRNHLLRLKGYDATEVLIERQQQAILDQ
jgi:HPr kinase/phosphorylase